MAENILKVFIKQDLARQELLDCQSKQLASYNQPSVSSLWRFNEQMIEVSIEEEDPNSRFFDPKTLKTATPQRIFLEIL
jgi:hypothetical protein